MKASLRSKILILSLASLVVIGTGCERRGRAPTKASSASGTPNVQTTVDQQAPKKPDILISEKKPEPTTSSNASLKELIAKAEFVGEGCDIAIDASEARSVENYIKDYTSILKLYKCEKQNGVVLKHTDAPEAGGIVNREWKVDSAPTQKAGEAPSKMLAAFIELATRPGSDDDKANAILVARIDTFREVVRAMNIKYGDEQLPAATTFVYKSGDKEVPTDVKTTLGDINKMRIAMDAAFLDLGQMKSVSKGAEVAPVQAE